MPSDSGRITFTLPSAPGVFRLRVAVGDASGRIGSTETDLAGFLTQLGPVRVSDVLTSWARADGQFRFLGLEDPPPGVTSLRVSIEIYPDATPSAQPFTDSTAMVTRDATATGQGPTVAGSVTIPIDTLPPGGYTLRATILTGTSVLGSVSRPLRLP